MKRAASPPTPPSGAVPLPVHRAVFRTAGAVPAATPRLPDLTGFLRAGAAEVARVIALPLTIEPNGAAATAPGNLPGTIAGEGFSRPDGLALAIDWPEALSAAVVTHRFGGEFLPVSVPAAAPTMVRLRAELDAAVLRAADLAWPRATDPAWPSDGGWSPGAAAGDAVPFTLTLAVAGHSFDLGLALRAVAAPAGPSIDATAAWTQQLRTALDAAPFDIRAVLHARPLRLEAALALCPGDVLPIETPRDVSLRIGAHALARGTITPDADGGHRVTIVAAPGAIRAPDEDCL